MTEAKRLIEAAFTRLAHRPGFVERADQRQLALMLSDLIEAGESGAFEAPTGLGKSLAALIPSLAHAMIEGRRIAVATYTNVLAEQYWRKDLPLALELLRDLDADAPRCQFLIGKQRYACLAAVEENAPELLPALQNQARLGIESEFRAIAPLPPRELSRLWPKIATPPICAGRLCPHYNECFYFNARRQAERAGVVVTNHSVVLQDALMRGEDGAGTLGKLDFVVVDEAHDLTQAARSALEFEISPARLRVFAGIVGKVQSALEPIANLSGRGGEWAQTGATVRRELDSAESRLQHIASWDEGILAISPVELEAHPQVRSRLSRSMIDAEQLAGTLGQAMGAFLSEAKEVIVAARSNQALPERLIDDAIDLARNAQMFLGEFAAGCKLITTPEAVSTSFVRREREGVCVRSEVVDVAGPLAEALWRRWPSACLSATLAIDGRFESFSRETGFEPRFAEILPSPFDYSRNAALYMPPLGVIPDPSEARKTGSEGRYHAALAGELLAILRAVGGRTLALFHSRVEMEAVYRLVAEAIAEAGDDLPLHLQRLSGAAAVGDRFRADQRSSLFALRSFWTGFDAPGETLSCVALVRVPFEVPVDPPQIARLVWLQSLGLDAFETHALPHAKLMMRQGTGRLIRRDGDKGLIAILDPRVQSKRYGEAILDNLPPMRRFWDLADAVGYLGIS
jgi:Rad3-related DNA helicase